MEAARTRRFARILAYDGKPTAESIRLIAAFIGHLQAQPDVTIMTVSSGLAFAPLKATPSYNASKAAIHMLSESLRLQLSDTTVKVVELVPSAVRTELMPGAKMPSSRPQAGIHGHRCRQVSCGRAIPARVGDGS